MCTNNFIIQLFVNVINSDESPYSFNNDFHCRGIFLPYYITSLRLNTMNILCLEVILIVARQFAFVTE